MFFITVNCCKVNRAKHIKKTMHKRIMSKSNINAEFAYKYFMKVISFRFNECFPIGSSTREYSQDFNVPWFTVIC